MGFFSRKRAPKQAPGFEPEVIEGGLQEPSRALESLASIVRIFGKEGFDIESEPAQDLLKRCEAWAQHMLLGQPAPDAATDDSDPSKRNPPAYAELAAFVTSRRKSERSYVGTAVTELKGTLIEVLANLRSVVSSDAEDDGKIAEELEELAEMVQHESLAVIRQRVANSVGSVTARLQQREQRNVERLVVMGRRLKTMKTDLVEAKSFGETDALTGLKNRGAFDMAVERFHLLASMSNEPLCLLIADLDHFKAINDTYGHPGGDVLLKKAADTIARCFPRKNDFVARYGGEEFVAVLANCPEDDGLRLASRLVNAMRGIKVEYAGEEFGATMSAGVAQMRPDDTVEALIERADKALYTAKKAGRNQAVAGSETR